MNFKKAVTQIDHQNLDFTSLRALMANAVLVFTFSECVVEEFDSLSRSISFFEPCVAN